VIAVIVKAVIGKAIIGNSERQISRGENGMATYPGYRPNADKLDPSRAALQERRFKAGRPEHGPFAKAAQGRIASSSRFAAIRIDINQLQGHRTVETGVS
jgi:hypothetical protein